MTPKLRRAARLAAADLLEPEVQRMLEGRFAPRLVRRAMTRQARALLDDPALVVLANMDPEYEAGYLPRQDVIVVDRAHARTASLDELREAVLEESLHRCLCALGLSGEDRHHAIIHPMLRRAREVY